MATSPVPIGVIGGAYCLARFFGLIKYTNIYTESHTYRVARTTPNVRVTPGSSAIYDTVPDVPVSRHPRSAYLDLPRLLPAREVPEPLLHGLDLPQVRLPDELGLGFHIQDPVRIPVVARARDEQLGVQIRRYRPRRREFGMVAQAVPYVLVPVDERQSIGAEVEPAEPVICFHIRARWD